TEPVFAFLDDTVGVTDGFADVVPPATPTVGGIFASLMPMTLQAPINPLFLSPTVAYSTFRLDGCLSTYIMRVRRGSDNVDIDIWDVNRYTSEYKTSELGSWIDGSSDTYFVDTLYNQMGTGNDAKQQGNDAWQPELLLNNRNGYPTMAFDGTDDRLIGVNMSGYINTNLYTVTAHYKPTGTSPTQPEYWQLPCLIGEECYMQMSRGILTSLTDKIWFGHWDGAANQLGIDYNIGEWAGWAQRFVSGVLSGIKNGSQKVTASEGSLGGLCNLAIGETNGDVLEGEINHIYVFDKDLSDNEIAGIYTFSKQN
ncbi:MAG: hypothetical protein KAT00_14370, partial [Planctomycetes bacterium]|nr:hypothetical protein [Planctomycetota bacterium]